MDDKDLEAFAKQTFENPILDEPSTNFDHLVMEKIRAQSIEISSKPILSKFKWSLIGLFCIGIIFGSFYFNTGNSRYNFDELNHLIGKIEFNYTTSITLILGGLFILIQVLFLKNLHKKNLANQ
jgi:hypothetical protein